MCKCIGDIVLQLCDGECMTESTGLCVVSCIILWLVFHLSSGVVMISKKGIAPSGLVSSTVNLNCVVYGIKFFKTFSIHSVSCIIKVLSTYLLQSLGGFSAVLRALVSKSSMY